LNQRENIQTVEFRAAVGNVSSTAQTLRLRRLAAYNRPGEIAQRFGRRRRRSIRSPPPAPFKIAAAW